MKAADRAAAAVAAAGWFGWATATGQTGWWGFGAGVAMGWVLLWAAFAVRRIRRAAK